mmetsp:Transcript_22210/g.38133  ORF Transcript_22210/g.38133 Transcript_22210/m.38133 type:complete len:248 (-) Transcript_22210:481-1224(-)
MGGRLHKIDCAAGAGEMLEGGPGEDTVHGVAKLVEQGPNFAGTQQSGPIGTRSGEVADERYHRQLVLATGEPPAAPDGEVSGVVVLVPSRVQVEVDEAHGALLRVVHGELADVGRPGLAGGYGNLDQVHAVQPVEYEGEAAQAVVEGEVRRDDLAVQVVLAGLDGPGIEAPVPSIEGRRKSMGRPLRLRLGRSKLAHLLLYLRPELGREVFQEVDDVLGVFGDLVGCGEVGVGREGEEGGQLVPGLY